MPQRPFCSRLLKLETKSLFELRICSTSLLLVSKCSGAAASSSLLQTMFLLNAYANSGKTQRHDWDGEPRINSANRAVINLTQRSRRLQELTTRRRQTLVPILQLHSREAELEHFLTILDHKILLVEHKTNLIFRGFSTTWFLLAGFCAKVFVQVWTFRIRVGGSLLHARLNPSDTLSLNRLKIDPATS
ncbi:hypothetical protein Zmor_019255 [Zophobas morio]|uniref:Uncharacterized protein n=1 Tax=Zophobas morio TaxID=2755281 RepID=A0AA38M8J2_9CUCU|nr:hypothetical protein Zmor_019255 [Zophobas morio]